MASPFSSRAKGTRALIALGVLGVVLAFPAYVAIACDVTQARAVTVADTAPAEKAKPERDCHKRADGQRTQSGKPCPDGGERLPQDRRSPLDSLPPLAPLVA
jgi:cell division septation protein DedD